MAIVCATDTIVPVNYISDDDKGVQRNTKEILKLFVTSDITDIIMQYHYEPKLYVFSVCYDETRIREGMFGFQYGS